MGNPSQSYGASLAVWDRTVLPATRRKWMCTAITPANQAGTRFTYPRGMEGWVDLGSLIAARMGIEQTTAWSHVQRPNRYATKSPMYYVLLLYNNTQQIPESNSVIRHVSFGMYSLSRDPLATNSTSASVLPARCRNGRNCFAFGTSFAHTKHTSHGSPILDVSARLGLKLILVSRESALRWWHVCM